MAYTSGLATLKPGHAATSVSIRAAPETIAATAAQSFKVHVNNNVGIDSIRSLIRSCSHCSYH